MKKIIVGIIVGFALLSVVGAAQAVAELECVDGSGKAANCPLMPPWDEDGDQWVSDDGRWQFGLPELDAGDVVWIDPPSAVGYEYEIGAGTPNFASVLLPGSYGGSAVSVWLENAVGWYDTGDTLAGGETHTFASGGVDIFRLLGIDPPVDETDPAAFVTGLTFVGGIGGADTSTVYQKPLLGSNNNVPEPATVLLLASGLLGFRLRKRR